MCSRRPVRCICSGSGSMRIKKRLRRAYRKGRKDGFDKGLKVANMIYGEIMAEKIREIERLNSEIIMKEEDDDGICEEE